MITIANPIYDEVFKYLMEDERIARTILSAIIKEQIISVKMLQYEHVYDKTTDQTTPTNLCIAFAATVRHKDGKEQLIHIELNSETLQYRQDSAIQHETADSMLIDIAPSIIVYLMGHQEGGIKEPVIYLRSRVTDYDGNPVTKGLPDPFVDSLSYDCIIVQIPLLHKISNTKLYRILSIFDQSYKTKGNPKYLDFDETPYIDDAEMLQIITRLASAAVEPEMNLLLNNIENVETRANVD